MDAVTNDWGHAQWVDEDCKEAVDYWAGHLSRWQRARLLWLCRRLGNYALAQSADSDDAMREIAELEALALGVSALANRQQRVVG